jgi:RNA polymerase sigma factor (sigma-70 family)
VYVRWNRSASWESPHAYARKVLINQVLKSFRRRASSEVIQADVDGGTTGEDPADLNAGRRDLKIAFRRLPLEQRAVLALRYYEDLSLEQTAQAIGCSVGTVKSRTSRALAALRSSGVLCDYAPEKRQEP